MSADINGLPGWLEKRSVVIIEGETKARAGHAIAWSVACRHGGYVTAVGCRRSSKEGNQKHLCQVRGPFVDCRKVDGLKEMAVGNGNEGEEKLWKSYWGGRG